MRFVYRNEVNLVFTEHFNSDHIYNRYFYAIQNSNYQFVVILIDSLSEG